MINFEKRDKHLLITGEGERKGLLPIAEGSMKMYAAILESLTQLVLIDYRKVNFNMTNTDVFNAIRIYETKLPLLKGVIVAAVFNKENQAIGQTWIEVGNTRGFNFKLFSDFDEAERWLLKQ